MPRKRRAQDAIDLTSNNSPSPHRASKQPRSTYTQPRGASQADAIFIDEDEADASQEVPDSTQAYNQQQYGFILHGRLHTRIVGVRYYTGYATTGEMVLLRREPSNPYDRNAIRVDNVQGAQIGHIPRDVASRLAKYIDEHSLLIEAQITGELGAYDCPIELKLYGTNDAAMLPNLMARMKRDRLSVENALDLQRREAEAARERDRRAREAARQAQRQAATAATPSQSQAPTSGPSLEDIIADSERFNPRNVEHMVEQYGIEEDDLVSHLPKNRSAY